MLKFHKGTRKPPTPRHKSAPAKRKRLYTDETCTVEACTDEATTTAAEALLDLSKTTIDIIETKDYAKAIGTQTENIATNTASTQTVYRKYVLQSKIESMILRNEMKANTIPTEVIEMQTLALKQVINDEKKMKFFTGLSAGHFVTLLNFLGPASSNLKYYNRSSKPSSTKPEDELFMTLVRLRRGYCYMTMAQFFSLSETTLRCIFTTWLQFLYCHFDSLRELMFPDRSVLRKHMPKSFKGFKNIRCSIDCTEFFVQMPRNLARQSNLYSNYKHHHTFKCLIAVAPNGTGVFVSQLYEGAISDREIFKKCGIMDHLDPGDLVLVDRGFIVEDLLMARQVHMNIPPFLCGREKLTAQEELLTRRIAKARIHVERYNERIKKFKLISGIIPLNMTSLASQAVFVACCLVNFQDQLAV